MQRVVIFGATSAIAAEVAALLAARGDRLVLVGRSQHKLDALQARLGPAVVGVIGADLDQLDQAEARVDAAIDMLGGVDIALIAHGLLSDQIETEQRYAAAAQSLCTNFLSAVALLVPLANRMEAQHHGTIAVMSSVAGERGRPRNYTYGAAKGGLTRYLQGLRSRLWSSKVAVHTFKLGPVETPMTVGHPKNALFAQPQAVAQTIVRKLEGRGRDHYVPGYWVMIMAIVRNLPEPLFQRLSVLVER